MIQATTKNAITAIKMMVPVLYLGAPVLGLLARRRSSCAVWRAEGARGLAGVEESGGIVVVVVMGRIYGYLR